MADFEERTDYHEPRENRAAQEFMDRETQKAENEKMAFVNMRETLLDVLIYMEEQANTKLTRKLKKRVLDSRSKEELRLIMDGLQVTGMPQAEEVDSEE